ncbi:ATP synthase F1 subunit gamma [Dialister invisus]|uniref:ATP synthase F1 subunit gamma n=1 Tax=Dialister invisus TaxID=218538 RepID=UPI002E7A2E39|nr:ATP synthase F1 subunit gamma [Dialister invisus]MEE1473445.1 ATP synthase F1 subunit gamma [Dialister invisus]
MESTRDIKGRIKSVTNIQQITKAMKMVAAARLRKAEEKANGSRPYAEKIGELLRRASSVTPGFTSPLFRTGEVKKVGYLVICGDKGLAGAYNSNVMKRTLQEISGKDRSAYALYVCGKQAKNYLKFRGYDPDTYHFGFSDKPSAQDSIDLSKEMVEYFTKEEVDEVYIIYTKFITALRQQVRVDRLLPIEVPAEGKTEEAAKAAASEWEKERQDFLRIEEDPYIFLPDAAAVLSKLLPEYIQVQVYNAMLQSAASELGSRMAAMSAATDNATERIADLNLTYNKARQAQVTNEISEIVGGAAALE